MEGAGLVSLSQSRDITLTQIPVKMFPIFSHVTLTSLAHVSVRPYIVIVKFRSAQSFQR